MTVTRITYTDDDWYGGDRVANQQVQHAEPARARVALSDAARSVSEYARALVPTAADSHFERGDWILAARRLRAKAELVIDAAMCVEHTRGATIVEIAEAMRLPEDVVERRIAAAGAACERINMAEAIITLDTWYASTAGPDAPDDAVSGGL